VHRDLRLELRSALGQASVEGRRIELPRLVVQDDHHSRGLNLIVEPVGGQEIGTLVVVFRDTGPLPEPSGGSSGDRLATDEHVQRLEAELRITRDRLQATIEELESTNEELKSSNEEYQSINEELQSANEEMETSKEELQSVNEELQTVNGELSHRVAELARSNSDLKNLLESTQIATVFLDNDLRVRNFTPVATDIFHLLDTDVGRPLDHVVSRVAYPELLDDVRRVLKTLVPVEREVADRLADRHYAARVLPYRSTDNYISGAVVTFTDLTAVRKAESALQASEARYRAFVTASADAVYRTSPDWTEMWELDGREFLPDITEPSGDWMETYILPEDRERVRAAIDDAIAHKSLFDMDHRIVRRDGTPGWTHSRAVPILDGDGAISEWLGTASDVTAAHEAATALRESEERFRNLTETWAQAVWETDAEGRVLEDSPSWRAHTGQSLEEWMDNRWPEAVHPEDREFARQQWEASIAERRLLNAEFRLRRPDGSWSWTNVRSAPLRNADGTVHKWAGMNIDITAQREAETALRQSEERLRSATEVARVGLWDWNLLTGEIAWSDEHFRMKGYAVGEVVPSYEAWAARIHPEDRAATEAALHRARDARTEYVHEFRSLHPDGSVHWLSARGGFYYDEQGRAVRMIGAMVETTEGRELQERQAVLVGELQHRTRNLMAIVRSMADKTMRGARDLADFRDKFRTRLEALSRVQGLLSRLDEHDRVTFDELLRTELSAHGAAEEGAERVHLEGPVGVRLRSGMVQMLAMALHELATNAVKYGALGTPDGELDIRWRMVGEEQDPRLETEWQERGVTMPPPGSAPRGTGQGRELIERALPYQLDAQTSYTLGADGVRCVITIPVSRASS
jgi:PAS domain S-box-containing protein